MISHSGEYISPERLEAVYGEARIVDEIWVYGDSRQSAVVAVVVPNHSRLLALVGTIKITAPNATGSAVEAAPGDSSRGDRSGNDGGDGSEDVTPADMSDARRLAALACVPVAMEGKDFWKGELSSAVLPPVEDLTSGDVACSGGSADFIRALDSPTLVGSLCRSPQVVAAVLQKLQVRCPGPLAGRRAFQSGC